MLFQEAVTAGGSEPPADATGDCDEAQVGVLHPVRNADVEHLGFVEEVRDVAGERDCRPDLVGETEVHRLPGKSIRVRGRVRRGKTNNVLSREIIEHAGAEGAIAPTETGIAGARNEAGNLSRLAGGQAAKISLGVDEGVVGGTAKALEESGEKSKLLLVAKLPALRDGGAGVGGGQPRESSYWPL